jgi:ribosomal protein S18 acetylase RimI-like enzyme
MLRLESMSESEYQAYLEYVIPLYADDKVQSGNWTADEALERARKEYENFLPNGIHTAGHFVGKMLNENDENVGFLWYGVLPQRPEWVFIYDFEVYAAFRRRGYATQALAALEAHVKPQGIKNLELHVFGHNLAARELYKKAGFIESNVIMTKKIWEG